MKQFYSYGPYLTHLIFTKNFISQIGESASSLRLKFGTSCELLVLLFYMIHTIRAIMHVHKVGTVLSVFFSAEQSRFKISQEDDLKVDLNSAHSWLSL
jgi:hypothetical protein